MSTARTPPPGPVDAVEVVRSEERLVAGVERRVTGSVRIGKRIVTEERTVTVTVRREELYVENLTPDPTGRPGAPGPAPAPRTGTGPVVTLTLAEEVPEVVVRVVPRETVRLFVDRRTDQRTVTAPVAREVVEHDVVAVDGAAGVAGGHDPLDAAGTRPGADPTDRLDG
jgi:stress response protein YsnF